MSRFLWFKVGRLLEDKMDSLSIRWVGGSLGIMNEANRIIKTFCFTVLSAQIIKLISLIYKNNMPNLMSRII